MVAMALAAAAAAFLFLIFVLLQERRRRRLPVRLPPGPRPWPLVGNLLQIGPCPHRCFMSFTARFGPVVFLRLGSVPTLVVDSPSIAREILTRQDHIFASRPAASIACSYFTYGGSDIAFAPHGDHWRAARKLATLQLLSPRRLSSFRRARSVELSHLVASVARESSASARTSLRDKFANLSCSALSRMLLGQRHFGPRGAGQQDTDEQKQIIYDGFALVNGFNIADYFPALRWLDLHGHERQIKAIANRTDEIYEQILREHRLKRKQQQEAGDAAPEAEDFVDVLLDSPGINGQGNLPDNTIKAIVIDLLSAGTDTSSVTSEWAFAELVRHPAELARVRDEIDAVVGRSRHVEESDLPRLRRLRAAVKEAFRMHPVGAFLIPHCSMEDAKVGGYFVPKGTRILVNNYALGRSKDIWGKDAEEFRPDRHLGREAGDEVIEIGDPEFKMLPFGAGRRSCPGSTLGTTLVLVGVARMVHAFEWATGPDGLKPEEIDMEERQGLTVMRTPLELYAKPRLELPSLYEEP